MLPIKLFQTFIPKPEFSKLDITLKVNYRLPQYLRVKEIQVSLKSPDVKVASFSEKMASWSKISKNGPEANDEGL